ncbi:MAG: hypothetical protein AAF518_25110 [Spirochaetota bacterium]
MSDFSEYTPLFVQSVEDILRSALGEYERKIGLQNLYNTLPMQVHVCGSESEFVRYCLENVELG